MEKSLGLKRVRFEDALCKLCISGSELREDVIKVVDRVVQDGLDCLEEMYKRYDQAIIMHKNRGESSSVIDKTIDMAEANLDDKMRSVSEGLMGAIIKSLSEKEGIKS